MAETQVCKKCGTQLPTDAPSGLCPTCLVRAGFEAKSPPQSELAGTAPSPAGTRFELPSLEEIAKCFPHLEIVDIIGRGGMGAVYKALQPGLDRMVAVKILPPQVANEPSFSQRFTREARALARLSHPNIVAVHDFGQTEGLFYIVMEFVDGANLREAMLTTKLQPVEALAIVPQICDALQYAHDEGVVHRDIKPENILLDKTGQVKIADFGLSKLLGEDKPEGKLTGTHQVMGTPRYMAPEQMEGAHDVDHRADIFSLGVVFYEMLTGELPLGQFEPPSRKVQVDVRLDEVVLRSLASEPERRYQNASEIKTDVEAVAQDGRPPSVVKADHQDASSRWIDLFFSLQCKIIGVCLGFIGFFALIAPFLDFTNNIPQGSIDWDYRLAYPFLLVAGVIVSLGAISLWNGRRYGLCVVSCVLSMLIAVSFGLAGPVGNNFLLFIPGVWGLILLLRRGMRERFSRQISELDGLPLPTSARIGPREEVVESDPVTTPQYGVLMMGSVMVVLGLTFIMQPEAEETLVFRIFGTVIALTGGIFTAIGFGERLPRGRRVNTPKLIQGAIFVFMGCSVLMFCFQLNGGWFVGNPGIWIGIGLVIFGSCWFPEAWKTKKQKKSDGGIDAPPQAKPPIKPPKK